MYSSQRSIPERSGAAILTVALAAGLLGGMLALSGIALQGPVGDRALRIFDVSAGEVVPDPAPEPSPAGRSAERVAQPIPVRSAPNVALVAPPLERAAETAPVKPPVAAVQGGPQGQPVGAGSGASEAVSAAPFTSEARTAATAGRAAERSDGADLYGKAVFREIRARQSYPAELARAGVAGTVLVEFRVSSRGRVYAVIVVSSDHRQLDRLAAAQVQSTPLPPPPRGEPRTFRIPMTYRMR